MDGNENDCHVCIFPNILQAYIESVESAALKRVPSVKQALLPGTVEIREIRAPLSVQKNCRVIVLKKNLKYSAKKYSKGVTTQSGRELYLQKGPRLMCQKTLFHELVYFMPL